MPDNNNNKFSIAARTRLIELGWQVSTLAKKIQRPRSTVSSALHSERFPIVRRQIAAKLKLKEAA